MGDWAQSDMMNKAIKEGMAMSSAAKKMGFSPQSASQTIKFQELVEQGMKDFPEEIKLQILTAKYGNVVDKKLLNNMLTDDNPQRLSRVMATVDEALELKFMGKSDDEIKQILKKSFEAPSSPPSAKLIEDTVPGSISQARLTFLENKVQKGGNIAPEEIKEIKQLSEIYGGKFATGGRVAFSKGKFGEWTAKGLAALMEKLFPGTTKLGQTSKPMAGKTELKRAIAGFQEREKAANFKIWEDPKKVREAVDDIFSTGDYKMDAEIAAEALVELNPKAFGGKLLEDLDDATRMDIYGAVLRVVERDLGKRMQLRKASKPTKTLEGIEKTGTINISDPNVADEFTRFMKETDPKGHKKIEEIVEITNFDPKGKKGHASGGLAGMLGE